MQGDPTAGNDEGDLQDLDAPPATDVADSPVTERRRPVPETEVPETESASVDLSTVPLSKYPSESSVNGAEAPPAGATLLIEARSLVEARRFNDAVRVLESVQRLRPEDPEALALLAVSHAYIGRNRKRVRFALAHLSSEYGERASTWRAVGDVAMARFQFDPAQHAARTAVQLDSGSVENWHSLAAAYAGNGWFEESQACLTEAAALEPVGPLREDPQEALSFGHWQIGRAVNFWAVTNSYFAALAMFGFLVFGFLGLAVALSAPMLLREIRVRTVPEPFRTLASIAWRREHRLRALNAAVVATVLVLWLIVFTITR